MLRRDLLARSLALSLACAALCVPLSAAIPASEAAALVALFDTTNGPGWNDRTNWRGNPGTECTWFGVRCNEGGTTVTGIFLASNGLSGSLPPEIGAFPNLTELSLFSNQIGGAIPRQTGNLTHLTRLELYDNRFSGDVPAELGELVNVTFFALGANQLTGAIPPQLGNLIKVEFFSFNESRLTGPIPPELGRLTNVRTLDLSYGLIGGTIPAELGDLPNITELILTSNQLEGAIPSRLGQLATLVELRLNLNQLSETIPPELGRLSNLKFLTLDANQLVGSIPAELGQLADLESLVLSRNQLSGGLPKELGQLRNLIELDAGTNQLGGLIPQELAQLTNLKTLNLGGNRFGGTIPLHLTQLLNLERLDLSFNQFTGSIPPELGKLTNLLVLGLSSNQLTGTIPRELGALKKLVSLAFSGNRVTGPIPTEFAQLTDLQELIVFENQISGTIPPGLGQLTKMRLLLLGGNQLSGTIPVELTNLTELTFLDLRANLLSGPIPPQINRLVKLDNLQLVANQLTGPIPVEISQLTNLVNLRLDDNELSGPIPPQLGQLTKLDNLFVSNNHLEGGIPIELTAITGLRSLGVGGNRLSGMVPTELGRLTNLRVLNFANNDLRGLVPSSLLSLTNLIDNLSDFRFNALTTTDPALRSFLNRKQDGGNWEDAQTIPPTNLRVDNLTDRSAVVSWDLIPYRSDEGGYRVTVTAGAGAQAAVGATASKELPSLLVRGLSPTTSYQFSVRTVTHPHGLQQNTITSDPAPAVSAMTTVAIILPPMIEVTVSPSGLVQRSGVPQNEDGYVLTNSGDLPTALTLTKNGGFFDHAPVSFSLAGGQSQTVRITSIPQTPESYFGESIPSGIGVPPGLSIPVRLLSIAAPIGTVVAETTTTRVDTAGDRSATSTATAVFNNVGSGTLSGIVVSDVAWIVPPKTLITIPPGGSASVDFVIDRSLRPDAANADGGALSGSLRLVYLDGSSGSASLFSFDPAASSPASGISVTTVVVVDTARPAVNPSAIPPIDPGQIARFIPGIRQITRATGSFISDLSVTNSFGTASLRDLRLFYTPAGASPTSAAATFSSLAPNQSVNLASVVSGVYGQQSQVGTVQVRTLDLDKVLVSATLLNIGARQGTFATAIPVFRSDRSVGPGQQLFLTGLRRDETTRTNMYLQEASGAPVSVSIEFLDLTGAVVGSPREPDSVTAFGLVELIDVVPTGAVSAIVTNGNGSAGRIVVYATPIDSITGDTENVVDWNRFSSFAMTDEVKVPFIRGASAGPRRRRSVRPASQSIEPSAIAVPAKSDVTIFNTGPATATATLRYYESGGRISEGTITLGARQTRILTDIVTTFFSRGGESSGYLIVTPVRGSLVVTSRVYQTTPAGGTYGSSVPTILASSGLRLGQSQLFAGLEDSTLATVAARAPGSFRTGFGIAETAGASLKVRATLLFFDGRSPIVAQRFRDYTLAPGELLLVENATNSIIGSSRETAFGNLRNVQLLFQVVEGGGAATIFTLSTDNGTDDFTLRLE